MHQSTRHSDREYSAHRTAYGGIGVSVNFVAPVYRRRYIVMSDEESARRWLNKNGLPKSEAKKLVDAALGNKGVSADRIIQTGSAAGLAVRRYQLFPRHQL